MSLIVVGTMAFDALETPFSKIDKIVGGSATYAAYSASFFVEPVCQISIIGNDFDEAILQDLHNRGVKTDGVEKVADKPSFFWSGKYHLDMNTRDTLVTDLNVLADFDPQVPESYQGCDYLLLGNLMPKLQKQVIDGMKKRPRLIMLDTMNFWMETAWDDLLENLKLVDLLMVNDSEARQLTNEYSLVKAANKIMDMGPEYLVIKKGEHGALLFHQDRVFFAPALPLEEVFDPTGAGDTFAGGFAGYLAKTGDISFDNMKTAIIVGSAMASFTVEKFGPERLQQLTRGEIEDRFHQFEQLVQFDGIVT